MREKCLVCDELLITDTVKVKERGLQRFVRVSHERNDGKHELFMNKTEIELHEKCRNKYVERGNISAYKKQIEREQSTIFDPEKCTFCYEYANLDFVRRQKKVPIKNRIKVLQITRIETQDKIMKIIETRSDDWSKQVLTRIANVNLIEAKAVYHEDCYKKFCYSYLSAGLPRGRPLSVRDVNDDANPPHICKKPKWYELKDCLAIVQKKRIAMLSRMTDMKDEQWPCCSAENPEHSDDDDEDHQVDPLSGAESGNSPGNITYDYEEVEVKLPDSPSDPVTHSSRSATHDYVELELPDPSSDHESYTSRPATPTTPMSCASTSFSQDYPVSSTSRRTRKRKVSPKKDNPKRGRPRKHNQRKGRPRKTSPGAVWNYFEEVDIDTARCKLCRHTYSRKGRGTSALRSHLKSRHKTEFEEYKVLDEERKLKNSEDPLEVVKRIDVNSTDTVDLRENAQESQDQDLDEMDKFFLSMSRTVKSLPRVDQIRIKMALHKAVSKAEIRQLESQRVLQPKIEYTGCS